MSYEPKTFSKGDVQKIAHTKAQEVALIFNGYKPIEGEPSPDAAPAATQEHEGTPDPGASGSPSDEPTAAVGQTYFATGPTDL